MALYPHYRRFVAIFSLLKYWELRQKYRSLQGNGSKYACMVAVTGVHPSKTHIKGLLPGYPVQSFSGIKDLR
jgi:hypothetical protein